MQNGTHGAVDFSNFVPLDTIEHEVRSLDGQPTGWIVMLNDVSHPKAQAHINDQQRRRLRREALQEQAMVNGRKYTAEERTPDEAKLDNIKWLVSRIVDWTPIRLPFISPEPITFSDEAATRVLMHPKMGFVLNQLIDVLMAEKSFTPRSGTASKPSLSGNSLSQPQTTAEQPTERN